MTKEVVVSIANHVVTTKENETVQQDSTNTFILNYNVSHKTCHPLVAIISSNLKIFKILSLLQSLLNFLQNMC